MDWRLATRRSSGRGVPRVAAKGCKALELRLCQPELIRDRQVLLPRSNPNVTQMNTKFAKVCCADKPDTKSSSISVSVPSTACPQRSR